jgi:hypothetical protein
MEAAVFDRLFFDCITVAMVGWLSAFGWVTVAVAKWLLD